MPDVFDGVRFEALRHIYSLTQRDLGSRLDIAQSKLSRIERGDAFPDAALVHRASSEFGEPLSFFTVAADALPVGPVAFRKKASTRASERDRVTTLFKEASRVFAKVSSASGYVEFLAADTTSADPIVAAERVRTIAGVGRHDPIRNVTRLLERLGVGVVAHLDDDEWHDDRSDASGISMPTVRNTRPLVATMSIDRGDVQRMTLAHELGHLILDRGAAHIHCSSRSPQERAAFEFAAALLLPPNILGKRITENSTLRDYLTLKGEYGMSAGAIVMHARRSAVITESRARTLQIQIASRGWRDSEPVTVISEAPMLFGQALKQVFPAGTYTAASKDLGVAPARLRRWAGDLGGDAPLAKVTSLRDHKRAS